MSNDIAKLANLHETFARYKKHKLSDGFDQTIFERHCGEDFSECLRALSNIAYDYEPFARTIYSNAEYYIFGGN